jgi:predicted nucleic acid-binding protein
MMSLENIFVDSSAWVALADKDDANHKEAASLYPLLPKSKKVLVTSNLIIAETYILILNELGRQAALNFLARLKASPRILRVYSNEDIEAEVQEILSRVIDQDFSYTDAVSFVMMKRQKIKRAFCFDKHFVIAGFGNVH